MNRIAELDGLRALAALAVLVFHLRPSWFQLGRTNLGEAAVNLFLVLSGYLITGIVLRNGRQPGFLRTFYIRRGLRIWPIYYLGLFVLIAINPFLPRPYSLDHIGWYLLYLQNIPLARFGGSTGFNPGYDHTWSLAVEEQFYLLWPILVRGLGRSGLVPLSLFTILVSFTARDDNWHPWLLLTRFDGFAMGGLLAAWMPEPARPDPAASRRVGLYSLAALVLATLTWNSSFALDLTTINLALLAAVGLVLSQLGSPWTSPLRLAPLVYIGAISYGLYLYHYPIYWALNGFAIRFNSPWPTEAAKLALTALTAIASWHLLEQPILRLKDRWTYHRPAALMGQKTDLRKDAHENIAS